MNLFSDTCHYAASRTTVPRTSTDVGILENPLKGNISNKFYKVSVAWGVDILERMVISARVFHYQAIKCPGV